MNKLIERQIPKEAQKFIDIANSMYEGTRYKIEWARHIHDADHPLDSWVVYDEEEKYIYEAQSGSSEDCVTIARRVLKIAKDEYDEIIGNRKVSSEAQAIIDQANELHGEVRYRLSWAKDMASEIFLNFVPSYLWVIYDQVKDKPHKAVADNQDCVATAKELLEIAEEDYRYRKCKWLNIEKGGGTE